jgi:hypothetical protein
MIPPPSISQPPARCRERGRRGISFEYAASYPLQGAFDFHPLAQRSLFEYAASCAESGRLWITVHSGTGERLDERAPVSAGPICPTDDSFIGRLAAVKN